LINIPMAHSSSHLEYAERYLRGELNPEEQMAFLRELEQDAELRQALLFLQALQESLKDAPDLAATPARPLFSWRALGLAATILLLMLPLVWWFWSTRSQPDPQSLFAAYYQPYPAEVATRTEGDAPLVDSTRLAYQAYARQDWPEASRQFRHQLSRDPQSEVLRFFLAQSLLPQGPDAQAEARQLLTELIAQEGVFLQLSRWYLALAYLQAGTPQAATPLLEALAQADHPKSAEAAQLLTRLQDLPD